MNVQEMVEQARDALTVKRVFGDPYEKDGVTIIPAASVRGGAGGGGDNQGNGGGGFGLQARPAGAFVIREGTVVWEPAVDINRLAGSAALVGVAGLLTVRAFAKRRRRARRK